MGIVINMADVTANYVDVRLDRKFIVLETYQNAMFAKDAEKIDHKTVQQEAG